MPHVWGKKQNVISPWVSPLCPLLVIPPSKEDVWLDSKSIAWFILLSNFIHMEPYRTYFLGDWLHLFCTVFVRSVCFLQSCVYFHCCIVLYNVAVSQFIHSTLWIWVVSWFGLLDIVLLWTFLYVLWANVHVSDGCMPRRITGSIERVSAPL